MPGAGAVHHIKPGRGGMSALTSLSPQLRTLVGAAGTAEKCQTRTLANYSNTSSAMASSDGGTVRPSIRAVWALSCLLNLPAYRRRLGVQARAVKTQGYAVAIAEKCLCDGAQRRACHP